MHCSQDTERRILPRHEHRTSCTLIQFENSWLGRLINVSTQGVLVELQEPCALESDVLTLHIELSSGSTILLHGEVVHANERMLGLKCSPHDFHSAETLKQLIKDF